MDREAERPKRERTENPQEEHPATATPKRALPPTVKLSLLFLFSKRIMVFTIKIPLSPTSKDVMIKRMKSR